MKKIFLPLLLVFVMLFSFHSFAATGKLSAVAVSGKVGEQIEIPVQFTNPGIIATRIFVSYDSKVLRLDGATNGDVFAAGLATFGKDLAENPYTVLWLDSLNTVNNTKSGTLFTLKFTVKAGNADGRTNVSLRVDGASTFDTNLNAATVSGCNVAVSVPTVAGSTTTTKATTTTTKATTTKAAVTTTKASVVTTTKATTTKAVTTTKVATTTRLHASDATPSTTKVVSTPPSVVDNSIPQDVPPVSTTGAPVSDPTKPVTTAASGTEETVTQPAAENATEPEAEAETTVVAFTTPTDLVDSEPSVRHLSPLWLLLIIPVAAVVVLLVIKKKK